MRSVRDGLWGVLVAGLLLSGCSSAVRKADEIPVWPLPPDPPRFIYETTLRSEESLTGPQNQGMVAALSGRESKRSQGFLKPFDIAARNGRIVVTDTVARVVHLFDVHNRKLYHVGVRGEGKLSKPVGVALDGANNIYVADVTAKRVVVYDRSGHFQRIIGAEGDLRRPTDVAVTESGDRIYVVDTGGIDSGDHQVLVYSNEGQLLSTIGERGAEPGRFNLPTQAAVGPEGMLYVLDAGNFRVQVFDQSGNFVRAWGEVGRNFGDLARPRGLAVDDEGNVYITDASFANVQIFNAEGRLLLDIGMPSAEDGPGRLSLPAGVAVDETRRVYVVDQMFNKVEVIRRASEEGRAEAVAPR